MKSCFSPVWHHTSNQKQCLKQLKKLEAMGGSTFSQKGKTQNFETWEWGSILLRSSWRNHMSGGQN
jgi:hypothetical protein